MASCSSATIGLGVRAERLSRGITQEEIAKVVDVSERQYSRYEAEESVNSVHIIKKIQPCPKYVKHHKFIREQPGSGHKKTATVCR